MHISQTILQLSVGLLKYPNVILWNDIDLSEVQYEPNRFHESLFCLGRWCARCPRRVTGDAVPRHAMRGDSNGGGQARTRIAQGAINSIILWAENNRCEAKWESFWFWALKVPVSLLRFTFQGILENSNALFLLDVRTFSQHFLFEIDSKLVCARPSHNSAFPWEGLAFEAR